MYAYFLIEYYRFCLEIYSALFATTASRQFLRSPFSSIAAIKLPVSVKHLEQIRQFASVQVLLCMQTIRNCSKYYGLLTPDLLEKVMMCPIQVRFKTATGISISISNYINRLNCCKKLPSNWLKLAVAVRCQSFSSKSPLLSRKLEIPFCTWVIRGWKNMAITHLPSLRWSSHESCASSLKCKTILVPLCSPKNCSSGASTIL